MPQVCLDNGKRLLQVYPKNVSNMPPLCPRYTVKMLFDAYGVPDECSLSSPRNASGKALKVPKIWPSNISRVP